MNRRLNNNINKSSIPSSISISPSKTAMTSISRHPKSVVKATSSLIESLTSSNQSPVDIVTTYLDTAEERNKQLNSFISIDRQGALNQIARNNNNNKQPLAGIPIAIKDNICTNDQPTTAGSQLLRHYRPPYDATAVAKLRAAGAIIIGKTNMDEFGMGSSTENSGFGPTKNPHREDCVPGGSSGGSAAAVAASQCVAALGSDTGGSIRQPAHFCGIVGVKPTYGRVSRSGLIAYASSLDCIGPMTTSVRDAALLLQVIAGGDAGDATSSRRPVDDYVSRLLPSSSLPTSTPLKGKKIGIIDETMGQGVDVGVEERLTAAAAHLEALGAVVDRVSLPSFALGLPAYYVIALSEASSNLSRYDGVRYGERAPGAEDLKEMYSVSRAALGGEVRRRIVMGTYALSAGYYDAYYKRAQQVRTLVAMEMNKALASHDVLLCPTAPTPAYRLGENTKDPLSMYKGDLMTVNVNLAGLPAVVVPCGSVDGLPVGVQLIGRAFGEADMLHIAHVFETTLGL